MVSAELYKRVNPDGSVEFTDIPSDKQDKPVTLSPMTTFKPLPPATIRGARQQNPSVADYTAANIISPTHETTIRDNAGKLTITASVTPDLQPGHTMILLDNGKPQGKSTSGTFTLTNVDRGAHALSIQVQDGAGNTLISSETVTVFLQRKSIIKPKPSRFK